MFATGKKYTPLDTWGSQSVIFNDFIDTGQYSTIVNLLTDKYKGCFVTVAGGMVMVETDDLIIVLQGSLDGITFDSDETYKFTLDHTLKPCQQSFHVAGYPYFRIYGYRDGVTDSILTVITVRPHR